MLIRIELTVNDMLMKELELNHDLLELSNVFVAEN